MKTAALTFCLATLTALPAAAQDYVPVTDKDSFLSIMGGRNLTHRLYGVDLAVTPDGQIAGTGGGWEITGTWAWQNGYFCREMNWGGDPIPYNCQLVEVAGNDLRFTTDQGAGDAAEFTLR